MIHLMIFSSISIHQFKNTDTLLLSGLKRINLFTGRNGCGKTSILEAIDKQMIERVGWDKSIWNKYQGTRELNFEKLESLPKDQFPNTLLIDNIEMGLHYSEYPSLWVSLIDFAALHNIQLFITTHSYECIESLVNVCKHQYPGEELIRLFRIEKEEWLFRVYNGTKLPIRYNAYAYTQEQLVAAIENNLELR